MDNIVSSKMRSLKPLSFYYNYFPWKWLWPFIEINVKPVTQGCFLPHLVNVEKVILEKVHMWKVQYDSDKDRLRHYYFFLKINLLQPGLLLNTLHISPSKKEKRKFFKSKKWFEKKIIWREFHSTVFSFFLNIQIRLHYNILALNGTCR